MNGALGVRQNDDPALKAPGQMLFFMAAVHLPPFSNPNHKFTVLLTILGLEGRSRNVYAYQKCSEH